jgi:hypothetical protein
MPIKFPSDEWIKASSAEINGREPYAIAAAAWEGDFLFVVQPDAFYLNDDVVRDLGFDGNFGLFKFETLVSLLPFTKMISVAFC